MTARARTRNLGTRCPATRFPEPCRSRSAPSWAAEQRVAGAGPLPLEGVLRSMIAIDLPDRVVQRSGPLRVDMP